MELRRSRVLEKLRRGELVSCVALAAFGDARIVEIAALAGIDCAWLDMEHVPNTIETIEHQIRAGLMHDMDVMVRVKRDGVGSYSGLVRPLEAGASGIMVPHIMSVEDAKAVAWRTRFHPIGRRAVDGGNAEGAFGFVPRPQYVEHANTQRFINIQIEDPEALAQVDDIAAVEGLDMLFFGPGDFAHSIGLVGQTDHPKVMDARKRVAQAARDHGKFAGTVCPPDRIGEFQEMGYQFLATGGAKGFLRAGFRGMVEAFEKQK